uniref:VWFA domain-containing protein n=1 Tax=Plectus sambesii TaxID=2011161 RepID=A0A914XJS6_9BILA
KLYGVNKLSNTNYDIWTTILGSNAYHLYEDYNSTSNVATQLEPVIVDYMNNLTCVPPRILDCQQYLDIVFVIHLSSVREHMNQTGEFLKRLALSYHLDTKYVHVGIVAYDSMTRFNNGWKFGFMSQADFNNMIDEIVHDTLGDTHNNITAPLWDVKNMIGFSRGYSIDGNRQFAADVIMYITDDVDHISSDDVMNARNYIYDTTDLNMPHVVIVAINTNASFANATFNNMQSVDMDLAVFAIESYDMLNTTVVNGADYEVNWINNYVCGLLPQSLPFYCVPGQRPTTIAPPTIPPAAQCHAMDIIFVVDMSQSPNGETLKRRYKELVHQLGSEISARTVFFSDPEFIDDFQNEKNMLKNITDTFPDGHYGPPVGVQFAEVSFFDRNTNITFYLNDANSQGGYDALIQSMLPFTGDTFIDV